MTHFDRIDWLVTALTGAIMVGALMLYPHFWIAMAIALSGCGVVVIRGMDLSAAARDGEDDAHRADASLRRHGSRRPTV